MTLPDLQHRTRPAAANPAGQPAPDLSPADLARTALRSLASLRLPPTPELFTQHYYAASGLELPVVDPRTLPDARMPAQWVQRVDGILGHAAQVTQGLADSVSSGSDIISSSLDSLVADTLPLDAMEMLRVVAATADAMHRTLRDSHAELLDARRSLSVIEAELTESRKLLEKDPLTGTDNRRAMISILEREIARARRDRSPMSVAMVDIDHFKRINDTHGHAVGDAALVHLTQLGRSALRGNDAFIRYGGEEFLLVMTETATAGALQVAQRLQQALCRQPFVHRGQDLLMTFSAGVATLGDKDTEATLLLRADTALYSAKRGGRNRVAAADQRAGNDPSCP